MIQEWRSFTKAQRWRIVGDVFVVLLCVAFTVAVGIPLGILTLVAAVIASFFTGMTWSVQAETQHLRAETAALREETALSAVQHRILRDLEGLRRD